MLLFAYLFMEYSIKGTIKVVNMCKKYDIHKMQRNNRCAKSIKEYFIQK